MALHFANLLSVIIMYTEEETLRIELPRYDISSSLFDVFTDETRKNATKNLIIVQNDYSGYKWDVPGDEVVTITETILNLAQLESITIQARIKTLPISLCKLPKLKLLDLSGCYDILSIPPEVLAMPNLKIKIGDTITPASEVFIIKVPKKGISSEIFSALADENKMNISQLIVTQEAQDHYSPEDTREEFDIPDDICAREGIQSIWMRGKFRNIPSFIFTQKHLISLGLSGLYASIPELLGDLKELTYLDLSSNRNLKFFPESIGTLSHLTSLNLHGYSSLKSLPQSMENLKNYGSLILVTVNLRVFHLGLNIFMN